jgi:hypothetical protein
MLIELFCFCFEAHFLLQNVSNEVEQSWVSDIVLEYLENASIGMFHAKGYSKKSLK